MKKVILMTVALLTSPLSFAEKTDTAEVKAPAKEALCRACHGEGGAKPILPTYPKLNGQNKDYLVSALKAYKSGDRKGGLAVMMTAQAGALSDTEMQELAAYYAAQK